MRLFSCCLVLLLSIQGALAQAPAPTGYQTEADQAFLFDPASGAVLFEKQADKLFAPASMSKLMTLVLLFKKLKAGEISLQTEFPVSLYAWKNGGAPSRTTAMLIPLNTNAKVLDLLQGITVQNANDACIAVAEGLAGSEDAFAQLMNDEARRIGLEKSTFGNSTGLPHPGNLMTARELALLADHIIKEYPEYYPYFAQKEFKFRSHNFRNMNPLLQANIGADGLRFGFTEGTGYGVVASAIRDGRRLIMVMNGLETDKERKEEAIKFLSWGFVGFKPYKVFESNEIVGQARVWGAEKRTIAVRAKTDVKIPLPIASKDKQVETSIIYRGPLKPPIREGDKIGDLIVSSKSGTSNTTPLYAAESIEPGGLVRRGIDTIVFQIDELVAKAVRKVFKKQT